jgi:hypothetical protein
MSYAILWFFFGAEVGWHLISFIAVLPKSRQLHRGQLNIFSQASRGKSQMAEDSAFIEPAKKNRDSLWETQIP